MYLTNQKRNYDIMSERCLNHNHTHNTKTKVQEIWEFPTWLKKAEALKWENVNHNSRVMFFNVLKDLDTNSNLKI